MTKYFLDGSGIELRRLLRRELLGYEYLPEQHVLLLDFEDKSYAVMSNGAHFLYGVGNFTDSNYELYKTTERKYISFIEQKSRESFGSGIELYHKKLKLNLSHDTDDLMRVSKSLEFFAYGDYDSLNIVCVPLYDERDESDLWRKLEIEGKC